MFYFFRQFDLNHHPAHYLLKLHSTMTYHHHPPNCTCSQCVNRRLSTPPKHAIVSPYKPSRSNLQHHIPSSKRVKFLDHRNVHTTTNYRGWTNEHRNAFAKWKPAFQSQFASIYERKLQLRLVENDVSNILRLRSSRVATTSLATTATTKALDAVNVAIKELSQLSSKLHVARMTEATARDDQSKVETELAKAKGQVNQKRIHLNLALEGKPVAMGVSFERIIAMDSTAFSACAESTFLNWSTMSTLLPSKPSDPKVVTDESHQTQMTLSHRSKATPQPASISLPQPYVIAASLPTTSVGGMPPIVVVKNSVSSTTQYTLPRKDISDADANLAIMEQALAEDEMDRMVEEQCEMIKHYEDVACDVGEYDVDSLSSLLV